MLQSLLKDFLLINLNWQRLKIIIELIFYYFKYQVDIITHYILPNIIVEY